MTHCDRCKGEFKAMMTTSTKAFEGGVLTVNEIPARKCDCEVLTKLPDGLIVEGFKGLLEKNGVIGEVTVSLEQLKERYKPMDFIQPYLN